MSSPSNYASPTDTNLHTNTITRRSKPSLRVDSILPDAKFRLLSLFLSAAAQSLNERHKAVVFPVSRRRLLIRICAE